MAESRLTVEYVSLPPEREAEWWAAMRWLVEFLKTKRSLGRGRLRSWHQVGIGRVDALSYPHYSTVVSV